MSTLASSGFLPRWFPLPGIYFEVAEAADTGGAIDPDAADAAAGAVDPEASGAAEPTDQAAPTETPGIDWDDPQIQARLAEMTEAQLQGYFEQLAAQGEREQQIDPSELDPLDPSYTPTLLGLIGQMLDQRLGPVQNVVNEFQGERIQQQIGGLVSETVEAYKEAGLSADDIELMGNAFANRVDGDGEPAVRAALKQGAEHLLSLKKSWEEAAVKSYRDGLEGVSGVRAEPSASGAALSATSPASTYEEATARVLAKHGIAYE